MGANGEVCNFASLTPAAEERSDNQDLIEIHLDLEDNDGPTDLFPSASHEQREQREEREERAERVECEPMHIAVVLAPLGADQDTGPVVGQLSQLAGMVDLSEYALTIVLPHCAPSHLRKELGERLAEVQTLVSPKSPVAAPTQSIKDVAGRAKSGLLNLDDLDEHHLRQLVGLGSHGLPAVSWVIAGKGADPTWAMLLGDGAQLTLSDHAIPKINDLMACMA